MDNSTFDINSLVFNHEQSVQIRFNDVDVIGHVNNSVVLSYFDIGKVAYFEALGYHVVRKEDAGLVIVNVNVDFMAPIFFGDDMVVRTKIYEIGNKSVKLAQLLFDRKSQRVKAVCRTVMCGFDPKDNTSVAISDEWRSMIQRYEKDL